LNDIKIRTFDDIAEGMNGEFTKVLSDSDVRTFADVSGDHNPIHIDEAYAKTTIFGGRIAHGMHTASIISAALGSVFPGPGWVYIEQNLKFKAPVPVGSEVTALVVATKLIPDKGFVEFATTCRVNGKVVLDGTAILMAPRAQKAA
jgi:3-hydroxybutyryl-CoA dehydratase